MCLTGDRTVDERSEQAAWRSAGDSCQARCHGGASGGKRDVAERVARSHVQLVCPFHTPLIVERLKIH